MVNDTLLELVELKTVTSDDLHNHFETQFLHKWKVVFVGVS